MAKPSQATMPHIAHGVINSISRNLSELGLKIQQFQSDQGIFVFVLQGRAGHDHLLFKFFFFKYISAIAKLTQEDKIHPLQG